MLPQDIGAQGEPESGALTTRLGGEEGVEHLVDHAIRDPRSCIIHLKPDALFVEPGAYGDAMCVSIALRDCLGCVHEEIGHYLRNLARRTNDWRNVPELFDEVRTVANFIERHLASGSHAAVQVEQGEFTAVDAGEGPEVVRNRTNARHTVQIFEQHLRQLTEQRRFGVAISEAFLQPSQDALHRG
jgi:hypothetical protein